MCDLRLCMVNVFFDVALKVLSGFPAVAGFDLAVEISLFSVLRCMHACLFEKAL